MPWNSTVYLGLPNYVAQPESLIRTQGVQVDWSKVDAGHKGTDGYKHLPAGSIVTRLGSDKMVVPYDDAQLNGEKPVGILLTAAHEDDRNAAKSGYALLVGGVLYKNLLPDAAKQTFAAAIADLKPDNNFFFVWETYADDTA